MSQYRWLKIVLVLLIATALPGLAAALGQEPLPAGPPSLAPEVEPNDTPWEATYLSGWRQGRIDPVGDVDIYRGFNTLPGLNLYIDLRMPPNSLLAPVVTLYDENENVLVSAACDGVLACLALTMPDADELYVRVEDGHGAGGPRYEYELQARYADPHEPNNFLSQATPFRPGEPLPAMIEPAGDVDFYVFTAEAGQEFYIGNGGVDMFLLDQAGQQIGFVPRYFDSVLKFEEAGTHYFQTDDDDYYGPHAYTLHLAAVDRPLLFSFTRAGTLGGVAFQPGDIVRYSPMFDNWEMYFDASDVGLGGNLVAFAGGGNHLYLTYPAQKVERVGAIKPQDVLLFHISSAGEETTGSLYLSFDGSDVGLTTAAESIDALGTNGYGSLVLSTKGNVRVPQPVGILLAQRDDVLSFSSANSGEDTSGFWSSDFDGASLGLGGANLVALDADNSRNWGYYLMFDRPVTLDGVTYQPNDVILCQGEESVKRCDAFQRAFDGALVGSNRIDAFSVLPLETP